VVKIEREGTVLLDAKTGETLKTLRWQDLYLHPEQERTARLDLVERKMVFEDKAFSEPVEVAFPSFAILSHAWGEDAFLWASPEGHLICYSFTHRRVVLNIRPRLWFNVRAISFNSSTGEFLGVASDWNGTANFAIFSIFADNPKPRCILILPKQPFCLFDHGRALAGADGTLYSAADGAVTGQLDWRRVTQ
jgi:hypothetical protein